MTWLRKIQIRLRALLHKEKLDARMDDEMRSHIEMQTQENIEAGLKPEEARFAAMREFGWTESIKEDCRAQRGVRWLEDAGQDIRQGARQLRKNPGFTGVAVTTLALGIGANTSLFTALDTIMLRPLPAPEASRLAYVAGGNDGTFSFPFYERLRRAAGPFSGFAAVQHGVARRELIATGAGATDPEPVLAQAATGSYFGVLGVPALLGRTLGLEDDRPGAGEPVAVISHGLWQRRFAADPAVLGKAVRLDDVPVTIVGVMPARFTGFEFCVNPEVWFPLQLVPQFGARDRNRLAEGVEWLVLVGRLRSGVTLARADGEVKVIVRRQQEEQLARNPDVADAERQRVLNQTIELHSGAAGYVSVRNRFKQPLVVLMAAVGVVLLIACTNVAGLLLARGAARQREFAVRAALGAGRRRIVRQLLTESMLLAAMGGAFGWLVAHWGTRFLASYLAEAGTPLALEADGRVLLFTIAVSLLTGAVFGLAPAFRLSRLDLVTAIKNRGHSDAGGSRPRLQPALVVAQVGLAVLLLAGAGLFGRTLRNLRTVELGFRPDALLSFSLDPGRWRPADPAQLNTLMQRVLGELESLPGVHGVSIGSAGMLSGNGYRTDFTIDGHALAPGEEMRAAVVFGGPRFFETLRVPLLRGREFTLADEPLAAAPGGTQRANVAILGETMARRFFGTADPIGRQITLVRGMLNGARLEVIGVAKDTQYSHNLREKTPLEFYLPFFGGGVRMPPTFYLRTEHSVAAIGAHLRDVVKRIEPRVTIRDLRMMDEVIDRLLVRERIIAQLVGFFSVFALLLASLGIYGLLSHGVAQRTREIGVRVALGATLRNVIALVIRQGLVLALVGGVLGMVMALMLTRFVSALLHGVTPTDPFTFIAVLGLLAAVALTACWLPARRAARVDPMVALRQE